MRVVAADIYDVDLHHWKPPIILRLITDDGLYGLGEFPLAYGTGRQAAIGILKDMIQEFVLGADPTLVEKMWHTLFRRTFWGQGGGTIIYGGMSTIDEALWDIKGKALGRPSMTSSAAKCAIRFAATPMAGTAPSGRRATIGAR
jgi:mandelate racemase